MLVLSRKRGQGIKINPGPNEIHLVVLEIKGGTIRIGFEADKGIPIVRDELLEAATTREETVDERG